MIFTAQMKVISFKLIKLLNSITLLAKIGLDENKMIDDSNK